MKSFHVFFCPFLPQQNWSMQNHKNYAMEVPHNICFTSALEHMKLPLYSFHTISNI